MNRYFFKVTQALLSFLLMGASLEAATVTVGCAGVSGTFDFTALQAAVNAVRAISLSGPHLILVSGNCTEQVLVERIDRVTIQGNPNATITLPAGAPGATFRANHSRLLRLVNLKFVGGNPAVNFFNTHGFLEQCVVEDANTGVVADNDSYLDVRGCAIHNNLGTGLIVNASYAIVAFGPSVIENNGTGIGVNRSRAEVSGPQIIRSNRVGISVFGGSLLVNRRPTGEPVIESNAAFGIILNGAVAQVSSSTVQNNGTGVLVNQSSAARLFGNTITGNRDEGVKLVALSTARLAGNTITGSSGFDLFCSPNSFAAGEKSGIGRVFCPGFNQSPDPDPGF